MKSQQMTEALEAAATQLGVRVRYESLGSVGASSGGGLCRIKGKWHVIIDKKTAAPERAAMLADALAAFDTEAVFLAPQVRELVHARREALRLASAALAEALPASAP